MKTLTLHTEKPVEDVVEMLQDLLDRAKTGEITGVAYVIQHRGGDVSSAWSPSMNIHNLKSGVMTLFARLALDGIVEEK